MSGGSRHSRDRGRLAGLEPLAYESIGECLERVFDVLARQLGVGRAEDSDEDPSWVRPADLVRILRPYIGWN